MQIGIEIRGDKQVEKALTKLGASLLDLGAEMDDIGRDLEQYYAGEAYLSQGQVYGMSWPRLSPKYATWKAKHFPGRPPLERTGQMRASFYHEFNGSSVVIKNKAPYFKYHQSWQEPRTKIPHRLIMAINTAQKDIIKQKIADGVRRKIDGAMQ